MNLLGKNVVIYGGGLSGIAAYDLVKSKGGRCIVYDDNPTVAHATTSTGVFSNADVIVLSPGVDSGKDFILDAKLEGKTVVGELELASEFCKAEQIAVTGTNGKTTTVNLINHILRYAGQSSRVAGNIGVAFSSICDSFDSLETVVVEASSFQLESTVRFAPDIAVILNIKPDHLDRHKTFERYVAAKSNIFLRQSECDKVVYNADDEEILSLVPYMNAEKIPFSTTHPVDGAYLSSGFVCYKGLPIVEVGEVDASGREIENVLAATAVATSKGISAYTVASALSSYRRPRFRREKVGEIDGISIFDDSKATNISATKSAIESLDGKGIVILGGEIGKENFDELFSSSYENMAGVVVLGDNADIILASADKYGYENRAVACDLEEAVECGLTMAKENGAKNLLFSPASKSFDRYKNFEERGKAFDSVVGKLNE